jgi:hypothetical protein
MSHLSKSVAAMSSRAGGVEPRNVVGSVVYGGAALGGAFAIYAEFLRSIDDQVVSVIFTLILMLWVLVVIGAQPANRR